jgi:hypothetical protein
MDQFDAVAVNEGEEGWISQESVTPGLMVGQQRLQTSAVGQATKQGGAV